MSTFPYIFEVHIHGQVQLRQDVQRAEVLSALAPLWEYSQTTKPEKGMKSFYGNEEPGIEFEDGVGLLSFCWTAQANDDFREVIGEVCLNLNELAFTGAALEVSFNDMEYEDGDDDDEDEEDGGAAQDARDELLMFFIGPTPQAILLIQRDVMIQDVQVLMGRHFERSELFPVVDAVKKMFDARIEEVSQTLDIKNIGKGPDAQLFPIPMGRNPRRLH